MCTAKLLGIAPTFGSPNMFVDQDIKTLRTIVLDEKYFKEYASILIV
jgi:hypothetical protein